MPSEGHLVVRLMGGDLGGLTRCALYYRPVALGFDTVGNGTLIAYDSGPVLVTDIWVVGCNNIGRRTIDRAVRFP